MSSVIIYMLRQTVDNRAPPLLFPTFSPLTVTFPKLSVILRPLYTSDESVLRDRPHRHASAAASRAQHGPLSLL
jgi:hypothetical protein